MSDLREALQNASGFLDTPVARRKFSNDPFYSGVVASIRAALAQPEAVEPCNGCDGHECLDENQQYQCQYPGASTLAPDGERMRRALEAIEPYLDAIVCYASSINEHHGNEVAKLVRAALAQPEAVEPVPLVWRDGAPPKPWADEWFIARTTFNDRVVLTALPEEYSYDFKTADDTYIKADRIKQWMQFPDSQFIAPPLAPDERMRRALEALQTFAAECHRSKWHFDMNGENPPNLYDARRLVNKAFDELQRIGNIAMHERDELKALSRADEGKESEGGKPCRYSGPCGWKDPTPQDATAQRDAIARIIRGIYGMGHLPFAGGKQDKSIESAADRILALQTRAGG